MPVQTKTLRKIVSYLNNPDEEGGFWLPNIQRPFVWSEDQICRLFDSILREYPISTLLIWKTNSRIRRRKFIDNWKASMKSRLSEFFVPEDDKKKCLVLDGQQRLQSLYIGLKGSFDGKELYFDTLSGDGTSPEDIKYSFEFRTQGESTFPWIKFKEIVFSEERGTSWVKKIIAQSNVELDENSKSRIETNVEAVIHAFRTSESITYQELDSIDNPSSYSDDDVVEIFIRANSGGTKLEKSDLLFSLLVSSWESADTKMEELLAVLNRPGFDFDRDFVLKTCLTLLDKGAQYKIEKFRQEGMRQEIEDNWEKISAAIKSVSDFMTGKTYIQSNNALPSYNALIPLIYVRYHFPSSFIEASNLDSFLVRTLLAGSFSGQSDQMIDGLIGCFKNLKKFDSEEGFSFIRSKGRNLEIDQEKFFYMGYGSKTIHLIFNLWYPTFNHIPAYDDHLPQVDHIFPKSRLRNNYPKSIVNQLANCMLLTREENGAGGKKDLEPAEWFDSKPKDYLEKHLIPEDRNLWKMDKFEEFIAVRKELIKAKFSYLLLN